MKLIQIVPGIFPKVDGMGDYSLKLARQLRDRHDIVTTFLVSDPDWTGDSEVEGFPIVCVPQRTSEALLDTIEGSGAASAPILVQFSPYGYQKRGCPFWFVNAMEQYAKQRPGLLHVSYHELAVGGAKPWSSAFYVPLIQRNLILRLARIANGRYTHTEAHRHQLEEWGSGRVTLINNFSSFGEPVSFPAEKRTKDLIVFGRAWQRMKTYTNGGAALQALCARLRIERIIDIGSPIEGHNAADIGGVPIVRCGRLESHEIDQWMATTVGNFSVYPVPMITKSSVYQLACAHGNITFLHDDSAQEHSCPGLEAGVDFVPVTADCSTLELPPLDQLAEQVYRNYQPKASWFGADRWARHLFGGSTL